MSTRKYALDHGGAGVGLREEAPTLRVPPAGRGSREYGVLRALCHDMRQPLTAIRLLADPDGQDAQMRLAGILHAVSWLNDLVDSVLGERGADERKLLDLGEVVRFAVSCAVPSPDCTVSLDVVGGVHVVARRISLTRSLLCLLDNATRAAGERGRVAVAITTCGPFAVVAVTDDGPGLGSLTPQHSIGLVTVRAVLDECGGHLALENGAHGGAVATIRLPLAEPVQAS